MESPPSEAPGFYAAISFATIIGLTIDFIHVNPVKALIWAAVLNGVVAAPLMVVIMMMASSRKVMGKFSVPTYLRWIGWIATGVMACVSGGLLLTWK